MFIGYDANDLPLDEICETIKHDIEDFINWNTVNQNYIDTYSDDVEEKINMFS